MLGELQAGEREGRGRGRDISQRIAAEGKERMGEQKSLAQEGAEQESMEQEGAEQESMEQEGAEQEGMEQKSAEREKLEQALATLRGFVMTLAEQAGKDSEYGTQLWQGIRQSPGLLQELAYYHDYGEFLCRYKVAGYTLADVLVWQVDHFKLYMDRPDEMNRYRSQRLVLAAFETLLEMEKDPRFFLDKMRYESGQDAANG